MTHTVETRWRETRAAALTELAAALEQTLHHVDDVEAALHTEPDSHGRGAEPDRVVQTGRAYSALLRARVSELRAQADRLT